MTKKTLFKIIVALIPVLLSACDKTPQPPLVFGATAWPGYEPVYLARELGYLQGANLRLDEYHAASEVEQGLRDHKVQVAGLPLDRALLLRQDMPDLKIILLFDVQASAGAALSGKGVPTPQRMDVLVTRDESIGQYHQELHQLLQGWRRALDYLQSDREKAVQLMAQREHATPGQFNRALQDIELYGWQRNQQLMIGEPPPVAGAIEAVQRALLAEGRLNIGVDTSMLLESTLIAEPAK